MGALYPLVRKTYIRGPLTTRERKKKLKSEIFLLYADRCDCRQDKRGSESEIGALETMKTFNSIHKIREMKLRNHE